MKLTKYEFTENELNKLSLKAFVVYLDSSFTFYQDAKGNYYYADNQKEDPVFMGDIENVNDFLEMFYEDMEEN